jgi:hypothetical protein
VHVLDRVWRVGTGCVDSGSRCGIAPPQAEQRCVAEDDPDLGGVAGGGHQRLLLEGRRLLAYTGAAVGDVAQEFGFAHAAYFSRFSSPAPGQSPMAYRAALLGLSGQA